MAELADLPGGAASQAVTGTLPGKSLQRAVLLSDGASRLVDLFKLATWEELLALLDEHGPGRAGAPGPRGRGGRPRGSAVAEDQAGRRRHRRVPGALLTG